MKAAILSAIFDVSDGANEAPTLAKYSDVSKSLPSMEINESASDEKLHAEAKALAIECIRVMVLAEEKIAKEAKAKPNHPIATHRIKDNKPVFAYAKRWTRREPQEACRNCPEVDTCEGAVLAKSCTGWV